MRRGPLTFATEFFPDGTQILWVVRDIEGNDYTEFGWDFGGWNPPLDPEHPEVDRAIRNLETIE